jgi:para-nitrobenzyl esterase
LRFGPRTILAGAWLASALASAAAPAAFAVAAAPAPAAAAMPARAAIATTEGPVTGTTLDGMNAYLGIPYARPPVGALRWQQPQRLAPRTGTLAATKFANHCPQTASQSVSASVTEDCLYLNIYTPPNAGPSSQLPVMVWIHGGSLIYGDGDVYNPDRLVARGVIVVTINYRLGYLGFLAQSALDAEKHDHADYGYLDQQAALVWVRHNIAGFGGNPSRITVAGESAGGESVYAQLASPLAAGLFDSAIVESGGYTGLLPTLAQSETVGNAFASGLGCTGATAAACLRALPVATILENQSAPIPALDGTILPQVPAAAFASGSFNRVPVLEGSNRDEFRYFTAAEFDLAGHPLTAAQYPLAFDALFGSTYAAAVLAQYPLAAYPSPDLAFSAALTDFAYSCPALGADVSISQYAPAYAYEFADEHAPELSLGPVSFPYGAAHATELPFIFDSFEAVPTPLTPYEQVLAATMVGYWTHFVQTGNPRVFGSPNWPAFGALEKDNVLSLVPPVPQPDESFAGVHQCSFWNSIPATTLLGGG